MKDRSTVVQKADLVKRNGRIKNYIRSLERWQLVDLAIQNGADADEGGLVDDGERP